MLGMSVNDAIALGTIVAAILAGWFGKKSGDALNKVKPIEPTTSGIAAGFVDKDLMVRLTMACESIASTLKIYLDIQTDENEHQTKELLRQIQESQDRLLTAARLKESQDDDRADRTAGRAERTIDRTVNRVESTLKKPRRD